MTFHQVRPEQLEVITMTAQLDGDGQPLVDDEGTPLPPIPTTTPALGRIGRPGQPNEVVVGQDTTIATYKAILEAGTVVTRASQIRRVVTGALFNVVGEPYRPLTVDATAEHHVEVDLEAVTT